MAKKIDYDEKLWFYHHNCEGKHYMIGNPHTFYGRMWAWCPKKERTFFVSKGDIEEQSEATHYWVKGYLYGNQPEPPLGKLDMIDFESEQYHKWQEAVALFIDTGYWTSDPETCENCGRQLLNSELKCRDCGK